MRMLHSPRFWSAWAAIATVFAVNAAASAQGLVVRGSLNLTPRTAISAAGQYAYAAGVNHLAVVDVSDPARPVVRGQTTLSAANVNALAAAAGHVFAAAQANGLIVVDVRTPAAPLWRAALALGAPALGVGAYDTLVAVGTNANVTLIGVRNPAAPHVLAQYGRAATWIDFDGPARKIYAGSATGAFSLDVQLQISGGDTTYRLLLDRQFGSQTLSPVGAAGAYVDVVSNAELIALRASDFTVAGQYTATGPIRAVTGGSNCAFLGLTTGAVVYLDQRGQTPAFVASAGIPAAAFGVALAQAGSQPLVVAAHNTGITVLAYDALAADDRTPPVLPQSIGLSAAPNPFNRRVELTLRVPQPGFYSFAIYDVHGRAVERFSRMIANTTNYNSDFTGRAAGVYFARLSGDTSAAAIKLLYLP